MMFYRAVLSVVFFALAILPFSCTTDLSYSPFEVKLDEDYRDLRTVNINALASMPVDSLVSFKVALITDSHYDYDALGEAVAYLNALNDIDFVVHTGDLTHEGIQMEYEFTARQLKKLNMPFFTVIGNHDCLANGTEIYRQMFGPLNYYIDYQGWRFVFFNDVIWENDDQMPDFEFLEETLKQSGLKEKIVFAHIPPFGDQFIQSYEDSYRRIIKDTKVALSVHGHLHRFVYTDFYRDGSYYLVAPSIKESKGLCILRFTDDDILVTQIDFDEFK